MDEALEDVDSIIDEWFGLQKDGKKARYKTKTSCKKLTSAPPNPKQGLFNEIVKQIDNNMKERRCDNDKQPSNQNWRFTKRTYISPKNKSLEKLLEKLIINETDDAWANAVPTSSGLFTDRERQRNIDLVHKFDENKYEFIELKVGSNNPLMAAMEILQNGAIYVWFRKNYRDRWPDWAGNKELLDAKLVNLLVLAPGSYFTGYKLQWLKEYLSDELKKHKMGFDFQTFDPALLMASRCPVTWSD